MASITGACRVSLNAFAWALRHTVVNEVVTDLETIRALRCFADRYNRVMDPSCGAVLAAVGRRCQTELDAAREVLVVLCGGLGTSHQDLIRMEQALSSRMPHDLSVESAPPSEYPKEINRLPLAHPAAKD